MQIQTIAKYLEQALQEKVPNEYLFPSTTRTFDQTEGFQKWDSEWVLIF